MAAPPVVALAGLHSHRTWRVADGSLSLVRTVARKSDEILDSVHRHVVIEDARHIAFVGADDPVTERLNARDHRARRGFPARIIAHVDHQRSADKFRHVHSLRHREQHVGSRHRRFVKQRQQIHALFASDLRVALRIERLAAEIRHDQCDRRFRVDIDIYWLVACNPPFDGE